MTSTATVTPAPAPASTFQPAWRRIGADVRGTATWEDACQKAGLDWSVEQAPMYIGIPPREIETPEGSVMSPAKFLDTPVVGNYRDDTGAFLGAVSSRYEPFQNREVFRFMDKLVQGGKLEYEAAGATHGGRRIWLLAKMPETDTPLAGDPNHRYILIATSHDGSGSTKVVPTSLRIVCQNMLALAFSSSNNTLSIRHTGNYATQLARVTQVYEQAQQSFQRYSQLAERMAGTQVTEAYLERVIADLYPDCDKPEEKAGTQARIEAMRQAIRDTYNQDVGAQVADAYGTAWGVLNAVTQTLDRRPRRGKSTGIQAESAFNATVLPNGADSRIKSQALAVAGSLLLDPIAQQLASELTL